MRILEGNPTIRFTDSAEFEDALRTEDIELSIIDPLEGPPVAENSNIDMDAVILRNQRHRLPHQHRDPAAAFILARRQAELDR